MKFWMSSKQMRFNWRWYMDLHASMFSSPCISGWKYSCITWMKVINRYDCMMWVARQRDATPNVHLKILLNQGSFIITMKLCIHLFCFVSCNVSVLFVLGFPLHSNQNYICPKWCASPAPRKTPIDVEHCYYDIENLCTVQIFEWRTSNVLHTLNTTNESM